MTVDPNKAPLSADRKLQMHTEHNWNDEKHLQKTRRLLHSTSFLYPILLATLLIAGTAVLIVTLTRRNTCRHLNEERIGSALGLLPNDHVCRKQRKIIF